MSISTNDIANVLIQGSICHEMFPCSHPGCKITLTDGREKVVTLSGDEINALIQTVANDKINNIWGNQHFANYTDERFLVDTGSLLTRIFQDT